MRSLITAIFDNLFVLNDKTQNPEKKSLLLLQS